MTDVTALVAALVDDRADAGFAVAFAPAPSLVAEVRPDALKRAIANLIDNALKYAGAARVAIRADGAALVVTVDDDGPGIPEADLERVFQPFYRLEDSRSRETGGIGLGLAIALSIAQSHGGTLKLANRSEGGLRATLSLPI
jgi:signal transduction histidine kinase